MQATTGAWKNNQEQPLTSEGFVEILYTINDPNAQASAEGTQQHEISTMPAGWNPPIVDETEHTVIPYATLERSLWLLDGSRVTVPSDGEYGYSGYVSNHLCDAGGSFASNPGIRIEFNEEMPILPGLIITWSAIYGDYPVRFRVTPYSLGIPYESKEVNGNTDTVSIVEFEMVSFDRIDIEVIQWGSAHRRARIERVFLGLFKSYTKSNLLKFTSSQTIDLMSASLPKYEVSFEVDNRDGTFDPQNEEGLSKYMMERQEISTRYGFRTGSASYAIEWIPGGVYYLSDWSAPQNGLSASFKARDLLGFLNTTYYKGRFAYSSEPGGVSLYTLAQEVLREANLPQRKTDTAANTDFDAPWELDEQALGSVTTNAPLPICTLGECLQLIANAAGCVIFFDREGILHIKRLSDSKEDLSINDRNSYSKPEVNLTKPVKQVDVSMYSFTSEAGPKVIYEGTLPLMPGTQVEPSRNIFIIEFSDIADGVRVQGLELDKSNAAQSVELNALETEHYAKSCKLVINSGFNESVNCKVTITGTVRKPTETIITVPNLVTGETQPLKNALITSAGHAVQVGEWLRDNLNRRNHLSAEWRADPGLDAGDIVDVGSPERDVRIISCDVSFSGAFKGKVEGVEV